MKDRLTNMVDTAKAVLARMKAHNLTVQAAGVAFFGFLAIVPTLIATISIYGLVSDPDEIRTQIEDTLANAPETTQEFLVEQMSDISTSGGLGFAVAISILLALWSASGAIANFMKTLNQVYEVSENRNFALLRGTALGFLVGAIVFFVVSGFVFAAVPALLEETGLGETAKTLLNIARFPLMGLAMIAGLGVMYRFGPDRRGAKYEWISYGAITATVLWLIVSWGFSYYTNATADEGVGIMGILAALLMWMWLTAVVILVGAEVDASLDDRDKGI